jgi:hypothetical protein
MEKWERWVFECSVGMSGVTFTPNVFPLSPPMLYHPTEADWILSDHVGAESTTCVCRSLQGEAQ